MVIQLRMLLNGRREQSARYGQLHPLDAAAHALNQRPILRWRRGDEDRRYLLDQAHARTHWLPVQAPTLSSIESRTRSRR